MIHYFQEYEILTADDKSLAHEDLLRANALSEGFFHTESDPSQVRIEPGVIAWHRKHVPNLWRIIRRRGEIVGISHMLPSLEDEMELFVSRAISEAELFHRVTSRDAAAGNAFYCSTAVVRPDHRGHGLALKSLKLSCEWILRNVSPSPLFYYWSYSKAGGLLAAKLEEWLVGKGLPKLMCRTGA